MARLGCECMCCGVLRARGEEEEEDEREGND